MLSSSLYTLIKLSKTTSPQKLFDNDCVTLYIKIYNIKLQSFSNKKFKGMSSLTDSMCICTMYYNRCPRMWLSSTSVFWEPFRLNFNSPVLQIFLDMFDKPIYKIENRDRIYLPARWHQRFLYPYSICRRRKNLLKPDICSNLSHKIGLKLDHWIH